MPFSVLTGIDREASIGRETGDFIVKTTSRTALLNYMQAGYVA